jgi:type I restriction enzyme S subunit
MSKWKSTTLGEQINLKRGYDLPSKNRIEGSVPIYSSSGISGFHHENMCVWPGVITGRYGTIGQVFFAKTPYWPLNTTLYVQDFKGNDEVFIYYFLQQLDWGKYSDKSAVPGVNRNDVHQEEIVIPSIPEQKAIAAVLSSLDDKIDLLHRQNKTLEAMAETLFRQWFIEEAKEDWEEKPLSNIANFLNGLACQKFLPTNPLEKLPVLKIKELSSGISENSDWATTDVKPEYIVESGDVIFAWSASLMVKVWDGEKCVLNQHLFKVTSDKYQKWFYLMWCKHHLDEFILISSSHATTMGHIKRSDLDTAMVSVPSPQELDAMSEKMMPLLDKQIAISKQRKTLENLRDTLLPKLMSGEVRVHYE